MKFNVALLQIAAFGDDQDKNLARGVKRCLEAKELGADLAVFPELWNIGASAAPLDPEGRRRWTASAIDQKSTFFQTFAWLARDQEINIALTYLEAHEPLPRNTVSIINRQGEVVLGYSKVFICDFGKDELEKPDPYVAVKPSMFVRSKPRTDKSGIAMANYPGPGNGSSQAHSCVAWREGQPVETLIAKAGEQEEILLAAFKIDDIREFRKTELWRMEYRRAWYQKQKTNGPVRQAIG